MEVDVFCADRFILRVLTEECLILTPVGAAGNACENLKYKANIACQARLLIKFTRLVKCGISLFRSVTLRSLLDDEIPVTAPLLSLLGVNNHSWRQWS